MYQKKEGTRGITTTALELFRRTKRKRICVCPAALVMRRHGRITSKNCSLFSVGQTPRKRKNFSPRSHVTRDDCSWD